jgi:hypothetical protein
MVSTLLRFLLEVNAEDTHDTVSMEDVLNIDGLFFGSDDGDEPITSAAYVDTAVELAEDHDEVEVNTERILFKDEYAKSIKPIMDNKLESMFARCMCSGLQIATHPLYIMMMNNIS